jgi:hypothetical protein
MTGGHYRDIEFDASSICRLLQKEEEYKKTFVCYVVRFQFIDPEMTATMHQFFWLFARQIVG